MPIRAPREDVGAVSGQGEAGYARTDDATETGHVKVQLLNNGAGGRTRFSHTKHLLTY